MMRSALLLAVAMGCGGARPAPAPAPAVVPRPVAEVAPPPAREARAAEPDALPDAPAPAPAELVGTVVIGDPAVSLSEIAAFVNAVKPGSGFMINTAMLAPLMGALLGNRAFDGLDASKPIYFVWLDGGVVVAGSVLDAAAVEGAGARSPAMAVRVHEGRFAAGKPELVKAAAPWILTNLVEQAPPYLPTLTIEPAALERLLAENGDLASGPFGALVKAYVEAARAVVGQVGGPVEIALEANATAATLAVHVPTKAGTTLDTFARAQQPADHALVTRLPARAGAVVLSGRVDWTALEGPLKELMEKTWSASGLPGVPGAAMSTAWLEILTGEIALDMLLRDGRPHARMLFGVTDEARAWQAFRSGMEALAKQAGPVEVVFRRAAFKHRGVKVDEAVHTAGEGATAELEKLYGEDGMTTLYTIVDGRSLLVTGGSGARDEMKALIDAARAKQPAAPGESLAAALLESRLRKESALLVMDTGSLVPGTPGFTIHTGVGFAPGGIDLRIAVPAAGLSALAGATIP